MKEHPTTRNVNHLDTMHTNGIRASKEKLLSESVKKHLDDLSYGIHTAHSSRRERFSYNRLESVLGFKPKDFDDAKVFAQWINEVFFPRMVELRVNQGLALESLRENCGHLSTWMREQGVAPIIIRQFKNYVSMKRGQLWKQLVKAGGSPSDLKPRLTPQDVQVLLKFTEELIEEPSKLVSTNMKYRKKANEEKARYRVANKNIAINLHSALRMGLMTTKRPNEIASIKRSEISQKEVILRPSKTFRVGETTRYEMWPAYWPSFQRLLKSHKKDTLFSLNYATLSNWFKSMMVACGFKHQWFNLHRLRSFGGDILAMAGANELEMMAHGDWKNSNSVQAYIGEQGRKANLERASNKKHHLAKKLGLAQTPEEKESDMMLSLILSINDVAHQDDGAWMTLIDTEETVDDYLNRTHGRQILGLDSDEKALSHDEKALLKTKMVDVPRFELGASTMPR